MPEKGHDPLLFTPPPAEILAALDGLPKGLDKVLPVRGKHAKALPIDVRRLSEMLTSERGSRPKGYLADAPLLSAYLRAFLPWNLIRLARLLPNLDLGPALANPEGAVVADLGAGPLTFGIALWLARPDLRGLPLRLVCVDPVAKAMRAGRDILASLAGPDSPWKVDTVTGGVGVKLRRKADLLVTANTLNELDISGRSEDRTSALARDLARALTPEGRLLVIEPGVRGAVRALTLLRQFLLDEQDMVPLAPCPHHGPCPMTGLGRSAWCHFTFPARPAPDWLLKLSARSELPKTSLSLSFLLMARADAPPSGGVRMVSGAFPVPGGQGQYGCSERGLVLTVRPNALPALESGRLIPPRWPEEETRDPKSGALVMPMLTPEKPAGGQSEGKK